MRKLTIEQFVERANKKYNNKFDYSKCHYIGFNDKIEIICPIHGSFWQTPSNHLGKIYGCNLCSPTNGAKIDLSHFLSKCIQMHGNKYDYSKVILTGVKRQITIICPIHGEFLQVAEKHYMYGCPACGGNKPLTLELFIERANIVHNFKYDYSNISIINGAHSNVQIKCNLHGTFNQEVNNHLQGKGCLRCSAGKVSKKEHNWMDQLGIPDNRDHRNVNVYINKRLFCVDGLYKKEKVIYEFLGDFWHGHPITFAADDVNRVNNRTFSELFQKTVNRIRFFRENGYKVFSIWERDFDRKLIK